MKILIRIIVFFCLLSIFSSCSLFDSFSNSLWFINENEKIEKKDNSQNCHSSELAHKDFFYYSHNTALNIQFSEYIKEENSKKKVNFLKESLAFSTLQAEADPHIISESSKISTMIMNNGKFTFMKFNSETNKNFTNYLAFLTYKFDGNDNVKSYVEFLNEFDKKFPQNIPASKSLEEYIEKNKTEFLKDENLTKLFFRGIAPIKKGESFQRKSLGTYYSTQKLLYPNAPESLELFESPSSYKCNFDTKNNKKEYANTDLEVNSTTFGIYKDKNNFFITTISSRPNIKNHYIRNNLGTNSKIHINTATCLNDKYIIVSRDRYFSREILLENFLNNEQSKNIDPQNLQSLSRVLHLKLPTRTISEIYGKKDKLNSTGKKINWLPTLGDIEVINLTNGEVFVDPRGEKFKCN